MGEPAARPALHALIPKKGLSRFERAPARTWYMPVHGWQAQSAGWRRSAASAVVSLQQHTAQLRRGRSANLMRWKCSIPGREGTDWQGGFFPLTMEFSEDYPAKPPKARVLCRRAHLQASAPIWLELLLPAACDRYSRWTRRVVRAEAELAAAAPLVLLQALARAAPVSAAAALHPAPG